MANDQPQLPVLQVFPPASSAPPPLQADQDHDDQSDHYFRPSPKECILLLLHKFLGNKPLPQCSSIFDNRNPYDPDTLADIFLSAEHREHGVYLFTKLSKKGKLINSNKNASRVVPGKGSWHCTGTANVTHQGTEIGTVRTLGYREKGSVDDHRLQIHEYSLPENTRLCYNPLRDYVLCHLSVNDRWCNGKKISKAKKTYYSNNNNGNNSSTSSTVTHDHEYSVPAPISSTSTSADDHPAIESNEVPTSAPAPAAIEYDQVPTQSTTNPAPAANNGYDQYLSPEPIATVGDELDFSNSMMLDHDDHSMAFPDDDIIFVDDDFGITEAVLREADSYIQDYTPDDDFLSAVQAESLKAATAAASCSLYTSPSLLASFDHDLTDDQ